MTGFGARTCRALTEAWSPPCAERQALFTTGSDACSCATVIFGYQRYLLPPPPQKSCYFTMRCRRCCELRTSSPASAACKNGCTASSPSRRAPQPWIALLSAGVVVLVAVLH